MTQQNVVIVFDRTISYGHVLSPFWVRHTVDDHTVKIVEIGAHSLPEAVAKTVAKGMFPEGWTNGGHVMPIPSGLHHILRRV